MSAHSPVAPRPRVTALLDEATRHPLTLVVAGAGWGKTTAVRTWAQESTHRVAWATPRPSDAGLWPMIARTLGRDVPTSPDDVLLAIAAVPDPRVLVLDDFHDLPSSADAEVTHLLAAAPASLRLVVLSRRLPRVGVERLRLDGDVACLGEADLACTPAECGSVLAAHGVVVGTGDAERLCAQTEGWAAGLLLVGRDGVDPREYLVAEVLDRVPPAARSALASMAVVDGLEPELIAALTQGSSGTLSSAGVHLHPASDGLLRPHRMLRDALRSWAAAEDPAGNAAAHVCAARWYAAHAQPIRAVRHALAGGDVGLAASLARSQWSALLAQGPLDDLAPLLEVVADPADDGLLAAQVAVAAQVASPADADELLARLRTSAPVEDNGSVVDLLDVLVARTRGDAARAGAGADRLLTTARDPALRSIVLTALGGVLSWTGDALPARERLLDALAAADDAASPWLRLMALGYLTEVEAKCGDLVESTRRLDQTLHVARANGWETASPVGAATTMGALVATLQCRFDDAATLTARAEAALHRPCDRPERAAAALPLIVLRMAEGRFAEALDLVRAAQSRLGDWPADPILPGTLTVWTARLHAARGDPEEAYDLLTRAASAGATHVPVVSAALARFHLDTGDTAHALALADATLASHRPLFPSVAVDLLVVRALALHARKDRLADRAVEDVLDLADAQRLLRPLLSHGPAFVGLLDAHVRRGSRHAAFVADVHAVAAVGSPLHVAGHGVSLSPREREVLGYLPSTMSNDDIAQRLSLSINTVKTHARAIYRKLGVDGRREAVLRARELGLFRGPGTLVLPPPGRTAGASRSTAR